MSCLSERRKWVPDLSNEGGRVEPLAPDEGFVYHDCETGGPCMSLAVREPPVLTEGPPRLVGLISSVAKVSHCDTAGIGAGVGSRRQGLSCDVGVGADN